MANSYFQFKQFIIHQDQCAMKVCTDACILGAWFSRKVGDKKNILDIGSGTGLLMLMLAQHTDAAIEGIEIDNKAFLQLQENIDQNEWRNRLKVYEGDVRYFDLTKKYDFIITNPPFFENDLLSASKAEQTAKHSTELSFDDLIHVIGNKLSLEGSFGILLPFHRFNEFNEKAFRSGYRLKEKLIIRQSPKHQPFRAVLEYSRQEIINPQENELVIQGIEGTYTAAFTSLLKPYYLKL